MIYYMYFIYLDNKKLIYFLIVIIAKKAYLLSAHNSLLTLFILFLKSFSFYYLEEFLFSFIIISLDRSK